MVGCDIIIENGRNMRDYNRMLGFYPYTIIVKNS
jgi:hypothetical protein